MQHELAARERRLRYVLEKSGHKLHKTPARSWRRAYYGVGYDVSCDNTLVFGCWHQRYQATLEECEEMYLR
jgi:hypothetical protein